MKFVPFGKSYALINCGNVGDNMLVSQSAAANRSSGRKCSIFGRFNENAAQPLGQLATVLSFGHCSDGARATRSRPPG